MKKYLFFALAAASMIVGCKKDEPTPTPTPTLVTKIELSKTEATLKVGESVTLEATVTPTDATTKTVEFVSSDTQVATVDAKGLVTAVAAGTADITAKATDGSKVVSAACKVTVKEAKTIFLKFKKALMRVGGKAMTQQAWYGSADKYADRQDITATDLTWTLSTAGVVAQDASTVNKFSASAAGETTIKATDADGNEIECAVTVMPATVKPSDYYHGVRLLPCDNYTTPSWKTKGTFSLGNGYLEQTQRVTNTNLDGYKLVEVNFYQTPCNASAIKNPALYLRIYISDVTKIKLNGQGEIELRSNMNSEYDESEELTWPWTYWCADAEGANTANAKLHLVNGWNNIVLPFALSHQGQTTQNLGGFRPANINYLRIFQDPNNAIKGLSFTVDEARIIDWTEFDNCDNFDMWYDRMTDNNSFLTAKDEADKKEGTASFAVVDHIIAGPVSNYRLEMWPGLEYAMPANLDQTNAALKFWLYVSDGAAFKGMHCVFELSSELINDAHNFSWAKGPGEIDFKDGWNEITLEFATCGGDASATSKRTVRKINYFRAVFTPQGAAAVAKPYTYKIDDIRIVKADN